MSKFHESMRRCDLARFQQTNEMTWAKNMQQNSSYPSQKHVTDVSLPMHCVLHLASKMHPF